MEGCDCGWRKSEEMEKEQIHLKKIVALLVIEFGKGNVVISRRAVALFDDRQILEEGSEHDHYWLRVSPIVPLPKG